MTINVTIVRIADKVKRSKIVPYPDLRFLGLVSVSFAKMISAMMMILPVANPSPRLEYTKKK